MFDGLALVVRASSRARRIMETWACCPSALSELHAPLFPRTCTISMVLACQLRRWTRLHSSRLCRSLALPRLHDTVERVLFAFVRVALCNTVARTAPRIMSVIPDTSGVGTESIDAGVTIARLPGTRFFRRQIQHSPTSFPVAKAVAHRRCIVARIVA